MTQIKFARYLSIVDWNCILFVYIVNGRIEIDQLVSKGHFEGQRAWR